MEEIKNKISDFVYDELDESSRTRVWQQINSDKELLAYYKQLKADVDLLDKSIFDQVDDPFVSLHYHNTFA